MSKRKKNQKESKVSDLLLPPPLEEVPLQSTVTPDLLRPLVDASEKFPQDHTEFSERRDKSTGKRESAGFPKIPGYTVTRKLGRGGMGTVYLAIDQRLDRQVAVKIVMKHISRQQNLVDRFAREVKSVAGLNHPNIAQLYEADILAQQPYYVMEYVDGETLEDYLVETSPTPHSAASITQKIAETIEFCHQKDVIHRDLKPSNILLDKDHNPKVADFGLAKSLQSQHDATKTGEILGTPGYMSPEQASGVVKTIGPGCDVYAIGAILYRMLTGRAPFYSPDPLKTVMMVLSDEPVAPRQLQSGVPKDLETICLKCLEKKVARRYHTAQELSDDLGRFLDGLPITARPVSSVERMGKWARRKPALAIGLVASAMMILGAIAGLTYHSNQLNQTLDEKNAALKAADSELARSIKLANEGSDVSNWIIYHHLQSLSDINGSNQAQLDLVSRLQKYLDAATPYMPDETKFRRRHGQAYTAIADVQGNPRRANLGQTDPALENYDRAIEIYEAALDLDPTDFATSKLLAGSLLRKAETKSDANGIVVAKPLLDRVQEVLDKLSLSNIQSHEDLELNMLNARLLQQHSEFEVAENNLDTALEKFDEIEKLAAKFDIDKEKWRLEYEHMKFWLGHKRAHVYQAKGELDQARRELTAAIATTSSSYKADRNNPRKCDRYRAVLVMLGDLEFKNENIDAALKNYLEAEKVQQEVVDRSPDDVFAKQRLALIYSRKASAFGYNSDKEQEIIAAEKSVAIWRDFVSKDPKNVSYQQSLALDLNVLGSAFLNNFQLDDAKHIFEEQHGILVAIGNGPAASIFQKSALAQCKYDLGTVYFQKWIAKATSDEVDPEQDPKKIQGYELSLNYYDEAVKAYEKLNEQSPLNVSDASFLEDIKKMRQYLISTAKKLSDLSADEEI